VFGRPCDRHAQTAWHVRLLPRSARGSRDAVLGWHAWLACMEARWPGPGFACARAPGARGAEAGGRATVQQRASARATWTRTARCARATLRPPRATLPRVRAPAAAPHLCRQRYARTPRLHVLGDQPDALHWHAVPCRVYVEPLSCHWAERNHQRAGTMASAHGVGCRPDSWPRACTVVGGSGLCKQGVGSCGAAQLVLAHCPGKAAGR